MSYLSYIFNSFYYIATTIVIPIPISSNKIFYLTVFQIFIGLVVLGLIIYFILRLLNFEIGFVFNLLSRRQNDSINYDTQKSNAPNRQRSGAPRARKGDVRYK